MRPYRRAFALVYAGAAIVAGAAYAVVELGIGVDLPTTTWTTLSVWFGAILSPYAFMLGEEWEEAILRRELER